MLSTLESERTPTKTSSSPSPPQISSASLESENVVTSYASGSLQRNNLGRSPQDGHDHRRTYYHPAELERRSGSRLRNQTSTATLRSGQGRIDDAASFTAKDVTHDDPNTAGPGALRQERRRKSAIWEKDVSRMRSESRLESHARAAPDLPNAPRTSSSQQQRQVDRASSRASIQPPRSHTADSAADTSGTEGSGPVMGDRRRKKSSTSSAGKRAAARAAQSANVPSLPSSSSSPPNDSIGEEGFQRFTRRSLDAPRPTANSVGASFGRAPALPNDSAENQERLSKSSGPNEKRVWPQSERSRDVGARASTLRLDSPRSTPHRARRFASDADAPSHLEARTLPNSGRASRISVDTSGVSRFLGHSPSASRPRVSSSSYHHPRDYDEALGSPSEAARQRKVSTSSTLSMRSSGGASDLHRSASRASMRRLHGRDVFDDAPPPPLPDHSLVRSQSPRLRTSLEHRNGMSVDGGRAHTRDRQPRTPGGDAMSSRSTGGQSTGLEDLRARLDDLTNTNGHPMRSQSRNSSRASRTRSNMSSTPALSNAGTSSTSVRPSTEPRKPHEHYHVELSPESKRAGASLRRGHTSSRLGGSLSGQDSEHLGTDASDFAPRRSASRLVGAYAAQRPVQEQQRPRHPVIGDTAPRDIDANRPLHARNLFASMNSLEQQILGTTSNDPDALSESPEITHMLSRFRDTCTSAVEINQNLRTLVEALTAYQVDAEMSAGSSEIVAVCAEMERGLGSIVRWSDDQVRNLTDSLMALAQCRTLLAKPTYSPAEVTASNRVGSASRASQYSRLISTPVERAANTPTSLMQRRASLDLRRTPNAVGPISTSPSISRHEGGFNHARVVRASPTEQSPARSRNSSDSGHRSLSDRSARRYSTMSSLGNNGSPNLASMASSRVNVPQASSRLRQRGQQAVDASGPVDITERSPASLSSDSASLHNRSVSHSIYAQPARDSAPAVGPYSLSPKKPRPSLASVTTVNATHQALGSGGAVSSVDDMLSQHLADVRPSKDNTPIVTATPAADSDSRNATLTRSSRRLLERQHEQQQQWTLAPYEKSALPAASPAKHDAVPPEGTMVLGLENATRRVFRSLGRHAGRQQSRDFSEQGESSSNVLRAGTALQSVQQRLQPPHTSGHASDASID